MKKWTITKENEDYSIKSIKCINNPVVKEDNGIYFVDVRSETIDDALVEGIKLIDDYCYSPTIAPKLIYICKYFPVEEKWVIKTVSNGIITEFDKVNSKYTENGLVRATNYFIYVWACFPYGALIKAKAILEEYFSTFDCGPKLYEVAFHSKSNSFDALNIPFEDDISIYNKRIRMFPYTQILSVLVKDLDVEYAIEKAKPMLLKAFDHFKSLGFCFLYWSNEEEAAQTDNLGFDWTY